jgi:hypothetical protein
LKIPLFSRARTRNGYTRQKREEVPQDARLACFDDRGDGDNEIKAKNSNMSNISISNQFKLLTSGCPPLFDENFIMVTRFPPSDIKVAAKGTTVATLHDDDDTRNTRRLSCLL